METNRLIEELNKRLADSEKEEIEYNKSVDDKDLKKYKNLISFGYRQGIKDALFLISLKY